MQLDPESLSVRDLYQWMIHTLVPRPIAWVSSLVKPPRVRGSPVAYECRLDRVVRLAEGPAAGNAVFGRIVAIHVEDATLGVDGFPDPARLDLIARLGGESYARLGERFTLPRPA